MKHFAKIALGTLILAGATLPADARVSVGIGIGPGYYAPYSGPVYGPPYSPYCDRHSRWYNPGRCNAYYYYDRNYYEPAYPEPFYGGIWFNGFGGFHGGRGRR